MNITKTQSNTINSNISAKVNKTLCFLMVFVGISGCFSVLFGAWLAHAGQALALPVQIRLASALQYQFIHTIALLSVLIWAKNQHSNLLLIAGLCFFIGILGFSGSLYLKTWLGIDAFGKAAPWGGTMLAIAWIFVAVAGKKIK
ncbi:MAG: DUF423 domain-containing protein [Thalassotalea sp.]